MGRPDAARQCGPRRRPWSINYLGTLRGLARAGQPADQSEDIVQDILVAVHLKRHTWDPDALFSPCLYAIARNKLIDALRRRGRRVFVKIDDFTEQWPANRS